MKKLMVTILALGLATSAMADLIWSGDARVRPRYEKTSYNVDGAPDGTMVCLTYGFQAKISEMVAFSA